MSVCVCVISHNFVLKLLLTYNIYKGLTILVFVDKNEVAVCGQIGSNKY